MNKDVIDLVLLLAAFQIKHFIIDFPLQGPWMYQNKGTLGHPGGLAHAGLHAIGTALCMIGYSVLIGNTVLIGPTLILMSLDGFAHYWIDWAKMNVNRKCGWGPLTHEQFWWLLGLDQFLHQMIYLFIIVLAFA